MAEKKPYGKMTCVIVDDEPPAREELVFLLSAFKDVQVLAQADSAPRAVDAINKHHPDFIFLDIKMPGQSGFDVLPQINGLNPPPLVVFITAYDQFAVEAFEKNAIDYIMKPFSQERLSQSISRIKNLLSLKNKEVKNQTYKNLVEKTSAFRTVKKISVERQGRMMLINPEDIMFCQYKDKKIAVHSGDEIYTLYGIQTLDQLEDHLNTFSFFRSHRNTIINFDHIREFSPWFNGKYLLTMNDKKKTELMIPRERVKSFKQHLGI